jgi:hypothetical protein
MKLLTRCATPLAATALIFGLLVGMAGLANAVPPPTSVSNGSATVSGVSVNGSGNNYALVSSTTHVVVAGNYAVDDTGCSGCQDQIQIGWAGSATPVACIYNGGSMGSGSFSQDLGPAPNAGVNEVIINFAQAAGCSLSSWWSSNAGPSIAEVAVSPPNSGSSGSASVSGVTVNGGPGNSAVTPAGSSVTVAGNYVMNAGCTGCGNQIQIGWAGSSAALGCIYADGPHGSGGFTFIMGVPPSLGANYVVIHAAQNSGNNCSPGWSSSGPAIALAYVWSPPTVTSVTPDVGPTAGGNSVTIGGTNFITGTTATTFMFGGSSATGVSCSSTTSCSVTVPAGGAGTVDVFATTVGGTSPVNAPGDQYTYVTPPVVTEVSPNQGPLTAGTLVTITGTNLNGATVVDFGSNPATGVTCTATSCSVTAPAGTAGVTDVTVTTPGGTSAIVPADQYTYFAPPAVTSVLPTLGPAAGGNPVIVYGTNLNGATVVDFGSNPATGVTCTATSCTVTAPAGTAGVTDVTVTTPGGTSATSPGDQYTYVTPPAVTEVSPNQGPLTAGTSVTITGTNLNGATVVDFGSNPATGVTCTATSCTVAAPAGVAGTVDVTVTTLGGGTSATNAADQYTYVAPPTVTNVNPDTGPTTGGTSVTLNGTNLNGVTVVDFGSNPATGVTCSATACFVTAPAGVAGTVDVSVTTPGGTSATSPADHYTYVAPPTVTNVNPNAGPLTAGTSVTITGTNFTGATAVDFGSNPATGVTCTATSCTVTAPAPAPAGVGIVDVTVTTLGGGTSATSAADHYTYVAPPTVTNVNPNAGPLTAGTSVTITGTNLTGATAAHFGANLATGVTCSATLCTVTAPAGTAGTVDVTVTTVVGTSATSPADRYTYTPVPIVTGILPVGGPYLGGTTVTIIGTNLGPTTSIHFGSTNAPGFTCSATTCTVNSPAGTAGSVVDLTVTTPGGTSATSPADQFTYGAGPGDPVVKGISPNSGPLTGGTVVTITGQGFSGATEVDFGDPPATNVTCSDTVCTATSPPGTGTVAVTVKGPGGTSVLSPADLFTYTNGPTPPPPPPGSNGYWLVASDGGIFSFGGSQFFGSTGAQHLNKPVVGMASNPDGGGYWLVASDGGIFAFGDAGFFGSTGAMTLNKPVVGMDVAPGGQGYWLVASDGGIFSFGNAQFFGSTGAQHLNEPIVGMASTPDGGGYWLVASDGGIFAFGDAAFYGSTGAQTLNTPIVGMASTPDGGGYWLVASDGGIFAFGDAQYYGSTGAQTLNTPIVGMASSPDGGGYWLVASDGGIFSFGDAPFLGSTGGQTLNQPIVGMASEF